MENLYINSTNFKTFFSELQKNIGGTITENINEFALDICNENADGMIRAIKLKGDIYFIEFDIEFTNNFILTIDIPKSRFVNFLYAAEGDLAYNFNNNDDFTRLETFQTAILSNVNNTSITLSFFKNHKVNCTLIAVDCKSTKKISINKLLAQTYLNNETKNVSILGAYNLKIADKIQQLKSVEQEGVARNLHIEGLVHVILALEIQQHIQDAKVKSQNKGSLNNYEMKKINELTMFINNYPESNLTVNELCEKGGLSAGKLQEGFKLMHDRTVNDYIRDVRVKKSEQLLTSTDMNISEILYSLGFSSRSYFSKIFKMKYNCSPKQYKLKNRVALSA